MKLKLKMIYAILRGRSVCYRMDISPDGANPTTDGAVMAHNQIRGLNTGIVLDFRTNSVIYGNRITGTY